MPHSIYEAAFGSEFQLALLIGFIVLIVFLLAFILDEDTSPQVVMLVGLFLIAIAAYALWYIENMKSLMEQLENKRLISATFKDEFLRRSSWFLYIFPFFSAAIGTNLISDVFTKRLHYRKPLTFHGVIKAIPEVLNMFFGFFILAPLVVVLMPFVYISNKARDRIPQFMNFMNWFNRRLYLNLLKIDIIFRNRWP